MTPIHEMKTRKATWRDVDGYGGDHWVHGVFFEVDGREVGVVIRDQPEAMAKPLIEAIAALPDMVAALRFIVDCTAPQACVSCRTRADAILSKHGLSP